MGEALLTKCASRVAAPNRMFCCSEAFITHTVLGSCDMNRMASSREGWLATMTSARSVRSVCSARRSSRTKHSVRRIQMYRRVPAKMAPRPMRRRSVPGRGNRPTSMANGYQVRQIAASDPRPITMATGAYRRSKRCAARAGAGAERCGGKSGCCCGGMRIWRVGSVHGVTEHCCEAL